uniref:Uncharacterized protein n=1 Tax=Palpitomonas bilix TaxID=652834 RepID=A0A7S3D7M1_9EUKA|mmetsp:Transcript_23386/g.59214  ORF Transcript_23386/g.59214 Transcript_23386/m.59214 type:complete len:168 (+) Transcript_23386:496-999(+)
MPDIPEMQAFFARTKKLQKQNSFGKLDNVMGKGSFLRRTNRIQPNSGNVAETCGGGERTSTACLFTQREENQHKEEVKTLQSSQSLTLPLKKRITFSKEAESEALVDRYQGASARMVEKYSDKISAACEEDASMSLSTTLAVRNLPDDEGRAESKGLCGDHHRRACS